MKKYKVAVIGAGLMGSGIAQVCAQHGYTTINIDVSQVVLDKAKENLEKLLDKKIVKGSLTEVQKDEIISNITYSTSYEDIVGTKLIIEAVPENMELKKAIFKQLDNYTKEDTILVTNTSGLSVSALGSMTKCADRVMGIHFFYPAPVMKLVELIKGIDTSEETYLVVKEFALSIDKEIVECPDLPGFIVNRILVPMMNEAAYLVMEGCSPADVDSAMKLGANHPMGPLELCDFVGIDVMLATMEGLYEGFKDSKYCPCPILSKMVQTGNLGRKTGKGFYQY